MLVIILVIVAVICVRRSRDTSGNTITNTQSTTVVLSDLSQNKHLSGGEEKVIHDKDTAKSNKPRQDASRNTNIINSQSTELVLPDSYLTTNPEAMLKRENRNTVDKIDTLSYDNVTAGYNESMSYEEPTQQADRSYCALPQSRLDPYDNVYETLDIDDNNYVEVVDM